MRPAAEAIEALTREIRMLANSDSTARAIESLRGEMRENAEERRKSFADLEARLRRVETALIRHRVRTRIITAACGAGASAATHLAARYLR